MFKPCWHLERPRAAPLRRRGGPAGASLALRPRASGLVVGLTAGSGTSPGEAPSLLAPVVGFEARRRPLAVVRNRGRVV